MTAEETAKPKRTYEDRVEDYRKLQQLMQEMQARYRAALAADEHRNDEN